MLRVNSIVVVTAILIATKALGFSVDERSRLVEMTESDNLPKALRSQIFKNKSLKRVDGILPKNIFNAQDKRDYENFHNQYSQWVIKKFARKWHTVLRSAQKKYSVDYEAVAAIMLVETGLGNFTGRYHVLSVYSSIVLEAQERLKSKDLPVEVTSQGYDEAKYRDRLKYKYDWALNELVSLVRMHQKKSVNAFRLKGSSAGAFGLSQFLPSSYLSWAEDGDKNGRADLFKPIDAIYSTANYLAKHGWKRGLGKKANREAVYAYNRSNIYVDTVLKVAKTLRRNLNLKSAH